MPEILIDKNKALEALKNSALSPVSKMIVKLAIDSVPVVDSGCVQHGKWVKSENGDDWDGETVCSLCGGVSPNGWYWKFCPHCGKEMVGRCFSCENNG